MKKVKTLEMIPYKSKKVIIATDFFELMWYYLYMKQYNPKYAIRISEKNFGFENNIKSVPLYAVFCI